FGYRAWEMPDVGAPMDVSAFRQALPTTKENAAGRIIEAAGNALDQGGELWLEKVAELTKLPLGVIEMPRDDGQLPLLVQLPACEKIAKKLRSLADEKKASLP